MRPIIKKLTDKPFLIVLFIVLIAIIFFSYRYLSRGTVVVEVDRESTISIDDSEKAKQKKSTRVASFTTKPGGYSVSAEDSSGNKSKGFVTIKARQKQTIKLTVEDKKQVVVAGNDEFRFLYQISPDRVIAAGTGDGKVKIISKSGVETLDYPTELSIGEEPGLPIINGLRPLKNGLFFLESSWGYFVVNTSKKVIQPIVLPDEIKNEEKKYGVSSNGTAVWVSGEGAVYEYLPPYLNPGRKISMSKITGLSITAGMEDLLFSSEAEEVNDNPKEPSPKTVPGFVYDLKSSKKTEQKDNMSRPAWSDKERQLAYIDSVGKYLFVYDYGSNKLSAVGFKPDIARLFWDNGYLFYSTEGEVWKYNPNTGQSTLFASTKGVVDSLSFGEGSVFATSDDGYDSSTIWKIVDKIDGSTKNISEKLPMEGTGYRISYNEILSPSIVVQLSVPLNGTSPGRIALYQQKLVETKAAALSKLRSAGIDTSSVNIVFRENQ